MLEFHWKVSDSMKNLFIISAVCLFLLSVNTASYAVGEQMLNTNAGSTYAGFGYTHGYIPVIKQNTKMDSDIMRYDVNNSKPADYYYNIEDSTQHYGNNGSLIQNYGK